jgi:hypothetical protein
MKARLALAALAASLAVGGALAQAPASPRQIGEPRPVQGLRSASEVNATLAWTRLASGARLAALRIDSPGAAALRVAIRVGDLPASAILRFSSPADAAPAQVTAAQVLRALARNRAAGEEGPQARTWWSPVVAGDAVVLEIELAADSDPAKLALAVPLVSHIRQWPLGDASDAARAATIVTVAGSSYACPGFLVARSGGASAAPYYLTRTACVGSQSGASSLQAFWPRAASGVGARLLYASADTQVAFVSLDDPPAPSAGLARPVDAKADPALEQWLGAGAAPAAAMLDTFSFP